MRTPLIFGLFVLLILLMLWGRNIHAPTHVRDKTYDLLLSILLSHSVPEISVDQLAMKNVQILDARSSREFEVSQIPGATWVGYEEFAWDRLADIKQQDPVAVYCAVGYRSERIAERLRRRGYTNVVNVYGGIFEWVNRGHPVVTKDGTATDAVHAYSKFWGVWLTRGTLIYE